MIAALQRYQSSCKIRIPRGECLPVFHYPDGRRVVGYPDSWSWLATGGVA